MGALSEFFSHVYTMTVVFFSLLLIEIVILFRSVVGSFSSSDNLQFTATRYLELIEEKYPTILYKSRSRQEPPDQCTVCLSKFREGEEIRKLRCKHSFHKNCLDTWLQQDWATCPLCRSKALPEDLVNKYRKLRNPPEYDGSDEEMMFLLSALHGNSLNRLM